MWQSNKHSFGEDLNDRSTKHGNVKMLFVDDMVFLLCSQIFIITQ